MTIYDPRTGVPVYYYYWHTPMRFGEKLRCGNAWYINEHQVIRTFADLYKLKVIE
jgi:hypothetical protein